MMWELRPSPGYFGFFVPLNQQREEMVIVKSNRLDHNYQRKLGCWCTLRMKRMVWNNGHLLRFLLVFLVLVSRRSSNAIQKSPSNASFLQEWRLEHPMQPCYWSKIRRKWNELGGSDSCDHLRIRNCTLAAITALSVFPPVLLHSSFSYLISSTCDS